MSALERAALRGKLAEVKERKRKLELRIEGGAQAIRTGLNTALTPIAELEVPQLAEQMDELVCTWGELQGALLEIERLEKELR